MANSKVQAWSSGLEQWENVDISCSSGLDIAWKFVHQKRVGDRLFKFYLSPLGLWYRTDVGAAPNVPTIQE
jgi:hypothetical protein